MNKNLEIVKRLLSIPGIDVSLFGFKNINPLAIAVEKRNIEIFDLIFEFYSKNIENQKWIVNEIIRKLVDPIEDTDLNQNHGFSFTFGKNQIKNNNDKLPSISSDKEKKVVNHILNRLITLKCIDINYHFYYHTLLTFACENNYYNLVGNILEKDDVDVNLTDSLNGDTPFIIAVKKGNFDIAKLLIDHPQTNVNIQNFANQTALIIASQNKQSDFIDLIISNEKFDTKESRLDYAFFVSEGEISKKLYSIKSLDVNYISFSNKDINNKNIVSLETPLIKAVLSNDIERVNMIMKHPSFNQIKSQLKTALKATAYNDEKEIFIELIKGLGNDINTFKIDDRNLLNLASISLSQEILSVILNNPNFDSKKSDIHKSFVDSYSIKLAPNQNLINDNENKDKSPIHVMKQLVDFDKKHDHLIDFNDLLPNGKSFFTSLINDNEHINELVKFFLDNGVDPNKPDLEGVFPLENAIYSFLDDCALELINSNKIDFNQKIRIRFDENNSSSNPKYTTYLHLAACYSSHDILEAILDKNVIDINTKNDLGNTPLIDACRMKNKKAVISLFEFDFCNKGQIDFLHKNNNGIDALQIAGYIPDSKNKQITDKDDFLEKILGLLINS